MRRLLSFLVVIVVSGFVLGGVLRGFTVPLRDVTSKTITADPEPIGALEQLDQPSVVYARDGSFLTTFKADVNRKPVRLDEVPQIVRNAILDVEDRNFYKHGGVDFRSVARAFLTNAKPGAALQGGSTITQQVVKNTPLVGNQRTIDRKIKEAVLANRLERVMTKDQIFERYLNLVYLGNGAYGVQAGAETYFDKGVGQLQPEEAAFLAGIIRNPLGYDPLTNPEVALERRNLALQQMVSAGHLSEDESKQLVQVPVPTELNANLPVRQSYFIEDLKQSLLDDPRLGETPAERYNAVFRGGLEIHSTFDPALQAAAEESVAIGNIIPQNRIGAIAALVAVEPGTGHVRAVVGGPGFQSFKYDIATHSPGRQPGSAFKVFTLLAALEAGHGPGSSVDGSGPCAVVSPGASRQRPVEIENYEGPGGGTMSMQAATAQSVNCAYERMAATVGLDKVVDMAKRLGLKKAYAQLPSVVIGAEEATPLELADAYATVANDGTRHKPTFVTRVLDSTGNLLFDGSEPGERVFSSQVARAATAVLESVITDGTASGNGLRGRPSAGKTGTTNDYTNAWFVGFTPQLSTAVWMGVPSGNVRMNVGGRSVAGATYPAPIWQRFMNAAHANLPVVEFPKDSRSIRSKGFVLPRNSFVLGRYSSNGVSSDASPSKDSSKPKTPRTTKKENKEKGSTSTTTNGDPEPTRPGGDDDPPRTTRTTRGAPCPPPGIPRGVPYPCP